MKALKVLYRASRYANSMYLRVHDRLDPDHLYSALPTEFALGYQRDCKTTPTIGKLMVYPAWDIVAAERFCRIARDWHCGGIAGDEGQMEVWLVDCHNLYKLHYLILPSALKHYYTDKGNERILADLRVFWDLVGNEGDPTGVVDHATAAYAPIWTTDWLVPQERVGIYDVHDGRWVQGVRRA